MHQHVSLLPVPEDDDAEFEARCARLALAVGPKSRDPRCLRIVFVEEQLSLSFVLLWPCLGLPHMLLHLMQQGLLAALEVLVKAALHSEVVWHGLA